MKNIRGRLEGHEQVRAQRNINPLDVLRGGAIADMVFVHFSSIFSEFLQKIIIYHDVALDGFLLVSGYSMGAFVLPLFVGKNTLRGTKKIISRAGKLLLLHIFLVSTVGILQFVLSQQVAWPELTLLFFKTILGVNQVGLFHILPLFIFLFMFSPGILLLIAQGASWLVVGLSVLFFLIGLVNPFIFSFDNSVIFPIVLWQAFFVVGIYCGRHDLLGHLISKQKFLYYVVIVACFILFLLIRHTGFPFILNAGVNGVPLIHYSRFPLNLVGFCFGIATWSLLAVLCTRFWTFLKDFWAVKRLSALGRNALLAFFVHAFTAKLIEILRHEFNLRKITLCICVLLSVAAIFFIISYFERIKIRNELTFWSRGFIWLFT